MTSSHLNTKTLKDMSEHDNLQDADGDNLNATPQEHSSTEIPTTSERTLTTEQVAKFR